MGAHQGGGGGEAHVLLPLRLAVQRAVDAVRRLAGVDLPRGEVVPAVARAQRVESRGAVAGLATHYGALLAATHRTRRPPPATLGPP